MNNNIFLKNPLDKAIINQIKNIFNDSVFQNRFSVFDLDILDLSDEDTNKIFNNTDKENIVLIQNDFDLERFLKNTSGEYLNKFKKKKEI